ncbi:calcium-binding protein [Thalassococcus sp. S3]|uniref:calcium-binding protein n=1 Tax=Thalassococcus sp. S3 TaxID=2017482 RepID=UPI0013EE74DB|nr:calcium-binding protein [Thalassococcus sp. S3]
MESQSNTEMAQSLSSTPTVTVENGVVRIGGGFNWIPGEGNIDPVRSASGYAIEVPVAGTPFDPSFRPPPTFAQEVPRPLPVNVNAVVGDPQTRDITQTGDVSVRVYNFGDQEPAIFAPDGSLIQPTPQLSRQFVGLENLRWVTDGANGTSNISTINFFLNFNADYSQLLSISVTQVVESSIFVPIPGDDPTVVASGNLIAVGLNDFVPINVDDIMGELVPPPPDPGPVPTQGDDVLIGTADADQINALGGNDIVEGGGGADTLDGGIGNDWLIGNQQADLLLGREGADTLDGGFGNDWLVGNQQNDVLLGREGFDTLYGGLGADSLLGNQGNDLLVGHEGADTLDGGLGNDRLVGNQQADVLFGSDGFDTLDGGLGHDRVFGGNGRDLAFLGEGNDIFFDNGQGGALGRDTVFANQGNDTIEGGNGDDEFHGQLGNDVIRARLGNDVLYGGDGFDTLDAGDGNDTVFGGNGRDTAFLGQGNDVFNDNGQGGFYGADTVFAGTGNDTIQGGNGNDIFRGEQGNDVIFARLGNDTLDGGAGSDTLNGGEGSDTFLFRPGSSADVIEGYQKGVDALRLDDALWAGTLSAAQVVSRFATDTGADVRFDFGGGNTILLTGVAEIAGLENDLVFF